MRYLIEDLLPLKELSAEARREKAIRHGHISTLHVWWARRPLVVARAAVLGALVPAPESDAERAQMQEFIKKLCQWEVYDGTPEGRYLLDQAREMIRKAHPDGPPKVLDSFAGGGSIPLEALRLGCEAYAVEYNPVAYLILKATLEYPQRYGRKLAEDVKRWGEWVLEKARGELVEFYPNENGETVIAYIWSRTVKCSNPTCSAEIPLFRQFWLARKEKRRIALKPIVERKAKRVDFEVVRGDKLKGFDPSKGTVRRAVAHCLICGTSVSGDYLRAEAEAGRMGHRLVAAVTTERRGAGRNYDVVSKKQRDAFARAQRRLHELLSQSTPWHSGLSLVPDEPSPGQIASNVGSVLPTYGLITWGAYFNARQALALTTFGKWVRAAHRGILAETNDTDYARAVVTYLSFALDRLADYCSVLVIWVPQGQFLAHTFSRHSLSMIWDYAEVNPFSEATGDWQGAIAWIMDVIQHLMSIPQVSSASIRFE